MSKIITLTPEQVKAHPFVTNKDDKNTTINFYNFLWKLERIPDNATIRCTHVNVAPNIQQSWFDYVKEQEMMTPAELSMLLLMHGPKAIDNLADNTVELQDDWYAID